MKVITPLNGYLLIRPRPTERLAGIEIPDSVDKEKATVGTVVVTNNVKLSQYIDWYKPEVGATVLFAALAPRKVEHEGEECLLVSCEDIYAIIQE